MSEKCKTCEHWESTSTRQNLGACAMLPTLIHDMTHLATIEVCGYFGCHAHVPKPAGPKIICVMVEYAKPTGGSVFDHHTACSPEVQKAAIEFMGKPSGISPESIEFLKRRRDEQAGG